MKKTLCIILFVVALLGCLLYLGYDYATDYIVKKTLLMVAEDKELQAQIGAALEQVQLTPPPKEQNEKMESAEENKTTNTTMPRPTAALPTATPTVIADDVKLSIDELKPSDKEYVMSIYKRFTAAEINRVTAMLPEGITPEEKQEIKSIVYAKVSKEEVNKLYIIAKKYQ